MPSSFETQFERGRTALNRAFGVSITFKRGVQTSSSFTARRTDYEYEVFGQDLGFPVKVTSRLFKFAVSDVVLGGTTIEPQEGDLITEGTEVFEVLPADGLPAVEAVSGGYEWLVRTKQVE